MKEPEKIPVHEVSVADAEHLVQLLNIVNATLPTNQPRLSSIHAEAMAELVWLNAEAADRLAEWAKLDKARTAEIDRLKAEEAAEQKASDEAEAAKPVAKPSAQPATAADRRV